MQALPPPSRPPSRVEVSTSTDSDSVRLQFRTGRDNHAVTFAKVYHGFTATDWRACADELARRYNAHADMLATLREVAPLVDHTSPLGARIRAAVAKAEGQP